MDCTMSDEEICLNSGPKGDLRVRAEEEPSSRTGGFMVSPSGAPGTMSAISPEAL
jgi:hypothetical protein